MPGKNHLNPKQIEKIKIALREEKKQILEKEFRSCYCSMTAKRHLKSLNFWVAQSTKYPTGV